MVSKMVKGGRETEFDMIIGLVNRIIVEGIIPTELEISTIVNYFKGKGGSIERRNYRELKLTDQVLEIAERITEKLIR